MATVKIKIEGFIQKSPYDQNPRFIAADMQEHGYLMIGPYTHEFEYELPAGWNPVAAEIATLEKKLTEISDEFMQQSRALKSRIADLKCLPAPAADEDTL